MFGVRASEPAGEGELGWGCRGPKKKSDGRRAAECGADWNKAEKRMRKRWQEARRNRPFTITFIGSRKLHKIALSPDSIYGQISKCYKSHAIRNKSIKWQRWWFYRITWHWASAHTHTHTHGRKLGSSELSPYQRLIQLRAESRGVGRMGRILFAARLAD